MRSSPHEEGRADPSQSSRGRTNEGASDQREPDVPTAAKTTTPVKMDVPMAEDRSCDLADITLSFVTIKQDHDLAPILANLPTGRCECPHWGVLYKGEMTVTYPDTGIQEVIRPGDAYYMTPGHTPAAIAGTEFVMFSPSDQLAATEAEIVKALAPSS